MSNYERCVGVVCAWGTCIDEYDPVERRIVFGFGVAGCPCDNMAGWNARHPAGKPKPGVPVRAKGRHGSRAQRAWVRHAYERDQEREMNNPPTAAESTTEGEAL